MKKAITLSIAAHLLLLAILLFASKQNQQRQHQQQKQQQNQPMVIEASLVFPVLPNVQTDTAPTSQTTQITPPSPESSNLKQSEPKITIPKPVKQELVEPEQIKQEPAKSETLPQPDKTELSVVQSSQSPSVQPTAPQQQTNELPTSEQATSHFDPYQSVQSVIQNENQKFFDQLNVEKQTELTAKPQAKSINSQSSPQAQPQIKALYETAQQVSPDTRVINYHGKCVQIQRTTDFNGFSQFKWSSTTLDCGADKDMKKQLKLSLDKFLKPKSIKPRELQ